MINKDFTERYKAVLPILENNLESIKNTKSFTKDNIVIGAYLLMEGKSEASVETLKTLNLDDVKQKEDYEVYEFLMYMCLNGYYDKNFLDREDLSEEHIGYNGFSDAFCAILKLNGERTNKLLSGDKIASGFFSKVREESKDDYFKNEHYLDDLTLVEKFSKEPEDDNDERLYFESFLDTNIDSFVMQLRKAFKEILVGSYGLEEYQGVFTFNRNKPSVVALSDSLKVAKREPIGEYRGYSGVIESKCGLSDLEISSERCFDTQTLLKQFNKEANRVGTQAQGDTDSRQFVYFPFKWLEIIGKCSYASNLKQEVYQKIQNDEYKKNIDNYVKYLLPTTADLINGKKNNKQLPKHSVRYDLVSFIYAIAKQRFNEGKKVDKNLTFKELYDANNNANLTAADYSFRDRINNKVQEGMQYFVNCVCTTIILMSQSKIDKEMLTGEKRPQLSAYRIKVVVPTGKVLPDNKPMVLEFNETKSLDKLQLTDDNIRDIEETEDKYLFDNSFKDSLFVHAREYTYTYNKKVVDGTPIFAYKALEALQRQGQLPTYNEIMLGREMNGTITKLKGFSKKGLHHIIAGSRSGKGVMCYNIFATLFGTGRPVFYLDRKPDTSVVMKNIAPNMFVINGQDYQSKFIPDSMHFIDSKDKSNYNIPKYLKGVSFLETNYADWAYFRAIMLFFEIICFMDSKDEAYKSEITRQAYDEITSIVGNNTPALVVDEFTNFVGNAVGLALSYEESSAINVNSLPDTRIDMAVAQLCTQIKAEQVNLASDKQEKVIKAQGRIDKAISELQPKLSLSKLYFTTILLSIQDLVTAMSNKKRAGAEHNLRTQVFLIGQELPYLCESTYKELLTEVEPGLITTLGSKRYKVDTKYNTEGEHHSLVYHLLRNAAGSCDYLLGAHPDPEKSPKLGGQRAVLACNKDANDKGVITQSILNGDSRGFAYSDTVGIVEKIGDMPKYFNHKVEDMNQCIKDNFTLFRPFLILNNGESLPPELQTTTTDNTSAIWNNRSKGEHQYIGTCINFCNQAGIDYDTVWSMYPDKSASEEEHKLDRRIGFPEYVQELLKDSNTNVQDVMGLSSKIANIYVKAVYQYKGLHDNTPDANDLAEQFCRDFRAEYILSCTRFNNFSNTDNYVTQVHKTFNKTFFTKNILGNLGIMYDFFKDDLDSFDGYYNPNATTVDLSELDDSEESTEAYQSMQYPDADSKEDGVKEDSGYTDDTYGEDDSDSEDNEEYEEYESEEYTDEDDDSDEEENTSSLSVKEKRASFFEFFSKYALGYAIEVGLSPSDLDEIRVYCLDQYVNFGEDIAFGEHILYQDGTMS